MRRDAAYLQQNSILVNHFALCTTPERIQSSLELG